MVSEFNPPLPRHIRISRDHESQRLLDCFGDADARRGDDALGTETIVGEPQVGVARGQIFVVVAQRA